MKLQCLAELPAHRENRIQSSHRILEDNRALVAAEIFHLFFCILENILSLVEDLSADDLSVVGENLHDGIGRHRFSGTGFANHSENLSFLQIEGDAVYGIDDTGLSRESSVKILYLEDVVLIILPDLLFYFFFILF